MVFRTLGSLNVYEGCCKFRRGSPSRFLGWRLEDGIGWIHGQASRLLIPEKELEFGLVKELER